MIDGTGLSNDAEPRTERETKREREKKRDAHKGNRIFCIRWCFIVLFFAAKCRHNEKKTERGED